LCVVFIFVSPVWGRLTLLCGFTGLGLCPPAFMYFFLFYNKIYEHLTKIRVGYQHSWKPLCNAPYKLNINLFFNTRNTNIMPCYATKDDTIPPQMKCNKNIYSILLFIFKFPPLIRIRVLHST